MFTRISFLRSLILKLIFLKQTFLKSQAVAGTSVSLIINFHLWLKFPAENNLLQVSGILR